MLKRIIKVLIALIVILMPCTILLNSFYYYTFNTKYYQNQYIQNGVYKMFGKDQVDNVTKEIFGYIQGKNNLTTGFLSETDKLHMIDVKQLIRIMIFVYFSLIISIIILLSLLLYLKRKDVILTLGQISIYTGSIAWFIGIAFIIFRRAFDDIFYKFHLVAFNNDYWLLNPKVDNLINLFGGSFFYEITKGIVTKTLIDATIFIVIGLAIIFLYKGKHLKKIIPSKQK